MDLLSGQKGILTKKKGLRRGSQQRLMPAMKGGHWGLLPLSFPVTWYLHGYADNALREESCAQELKLL